MLKVGSIAESDVLGIFAIQSSAYPEALREPLAVLRTRWELAPHFCYLASLQTAPTERKRHAGYLLAHPFPPEQSLGLGRPLESIPPESTAIHLHDLAVDPRFQGQGIAGRLLTTLYAAADEAGFRQVTLVAVGAAAPFWKSKGFETLGPVKNYDQNALLMTLDLSTQT